MSMGAIFDELQAIFPNKIHDGGHVAGMPLHVSNDQGLGPGSYSSFNIHWIDVAGIRFGVNENRKGVDDENGHDCG